TAARRVLVVGDDRVLRERLRTLLEGAGHVVEVCVDGGDALESLRTPGRGPAMMVVDFDMLDLSAWGLLDAVRAEEMLAGMPIAILTSGHGPADVSGLTVFSPPLVPKSVLAWCAQHARE